MQIHDVVLSQNEPEFVTKILVLGPKFSRYWAQCWDSPIFILGRKFKFKIASEFGNKMVIHRGNGICARPAVRLRGVIDAKL